MRPNTTEDVFELIDGFVIAAVLGAAMEMGLFWLLAEKPMSSEEIAERLDIPFNRCRNMLQLLEKTGLLVESATGYSPSDTTRETILDVYSRETWAFLAHSYRVETPAVRELAVNICKPVSTWELQDLKPPDYFEQIQKDADYAARFTRMLREIHLELAEEVAGMLDLHGTARLMDIGGGSGVVSHTLLRKHPDLTSVVVENEHVCPVGLEIARENNLEDRISYLAADFVKDDLPGSFDLAMMCDVGPQNVGIFRKINAALNDNGRLVIVDKFAPDRNTAVPSRLVWSMLGSLQRPAQDYDLKTADRVIIRLQQAGFRDCMARPVQCEERIRWSQDWTLIEARK